MKEKSIKLHSKKSLLTGSIIAISVVAMPYIFYSYEIFPDNPVWENSVFTFKSNYFESVRMAFWVVLSKFIPLVLLIIWFLTCKHWWYRTILIPIAMFTFQLFYVLHDDIKYIDEDELYIIVPLVIVVLSLTHASRSQIQDIIQNKDIERIERTIRKPSDRFVD